MATFPLSLTKIVKHLILFIQMFGDLSLFLIVLERDGLFPLLMNIINIISRRISSINLESCYTKENLHILNSNNKPLKF